MLVSTQSMHIAHGCEDKLRHITWEEHLSPWRQQSPGKQECTNHIVRNISEKLLSLRREGKEKISFKRNWSFLNSVVDDQRFNVTLYSLPHT